MTYRGHVKNGMVVLDPPARLREGTEVRVEPVLLPQGSGCFAEATADFEPSALEAMRDRLTAEQYEALRAIATQGGPDVAAIARFRAASMT